MAPGAIGGADAHHAVGVIKLDDRVKVTSQIVDCDVETLAIGDRMRREF